MTSRVTARCRRIARVLALAVLLTVSTSHAQFVDHFDDASMEGWEFSTGDGVATMDFSAGGDGSAVMEVDATRDRDNIWWALIRRDVSDALDLELLNEPHHELRIEARIRVSAAPRRVNLHANTQRTTDFHSHLMEYDIPDTTNWHVISMTTRDFDARPGDQVNGQMAMIDWGLGAYDVEVDYYRVDVVDTTQSGPDLGEQVPYHPPIPPLESFSERLETAEDGMLDLEHPDINLASWQVAATGTPVLTVDGTRYVVLRWNLDTYDAGDVTEPGVLAMTTHTVQHAEYELEEYGQIRLSEIHGGDAEWRDETLTLNAFTQGDPLEAVFNPQMIVDMRPDPEDGSTTLVTIPRPVLRRMITGETRGIILRPLGPVSASFYAAEADAADGPVLYFDVRGAGSSTDQIRLNQVGFYPDAPKVAVVVGAPAATFFVVSAAADTVFEGRLGASETWAQSGETVRIADFSRLEATGSYRVVVPGIGPSHPFEVRSHVHEHAARGALKAYSFMRASTALEASYAGKWARPAGHPDVAVRIHPSAASAGRPAGTRIGAPKGWYDAGDYNKYVVNSGISVGTLLMLYEHYTAYLDALATNIPESENAVPDLLDEVAWNLAWMLDMQDPADGGVYHKLTTPNFEGAVMPHQAVQPRYVVRKTTAAALNLAAVMAIGARIYDRYDHAYPGLADEMLEAAKLAWDWARENPDVPYDQRGMNEEYDPDVVTGAYGDDSFSDEFDWAAAELFITTRDDDFLEAHGAARDSEIGAPSWSSVGSLAYISLAHHRSPIADGIDTTIVKRRLVDLADEYLRAKDLSPYAVVMGRDGDFFWGSNSLAGNQGVMLLQAYRLTGEKAYLEAALSNLDYLLGRNATGFSFVTGFGDRTPMHIHHRPSQADGIVDPVPGLVVGGPNPGRQDGCSYTSTLPARAYVDDWCSYASNEITINWNAPFVYLAVAIEAELAEAGLPAGLDDR